MSTTWKDYKYPGRESDDDPRALATGLKALELSDPPMYDPTKYGGIHTTSTSANTLYTEFVTHTVPDVQPDTHVVAVLGISGEDKAGIVNASPQKCGFMLSDFMAFWHILQGKTSHQTWLHALDFDALVPKYKQWLHGNPYKDGRKVVLDEDVLKSLEKSKHPPTRCEVSALRKTFTKCLKEACAAAEGTNKTVLVLVFAHGMGDAVDDVSFGVEIGQERRRSLTLSQRHFLRAIKVPTEVNVTLLTTACYTGGWICNLMPPGLTAMTACSAGTMSHSWSFSASNSRASGTMYATTIIEQLTSDPEAKKPLYDPDDDDTTDEQSRSYAAFTHDTMSRLFHQLDKRAYEHEMRVTAQDDDWEANWKVRLGIPLREMEKAWSALKTWPKDPQLHPGDPWNRDPNVSQEERDEFKKSEREWRLAGAPESHRLIHRSATAAKTFSTIKELAKDYLPYNEELTDNFHDGALHALLRRIIYGGEPEPSPNECAGALEELEYRLNQTAHATAYLRMMEISLPGGKEGHEFDTSKIPRFRDAVEYKETFGKTVSLKELFPSPSPGQGFFYAKGMLYFLYALKASKMDDSIIKAKLTSLAKIVREKVGTLKADLEKEEVNTLKRRDVFHSYGKAMLSPREKHRRQGGSDTLRDMFASSDEASPLIVVAQSPATD